jgi:hypothetical protein
MVVVFESCCARIIILMAECLTCILVGCHHKVVLLDFSLFISCSEILFSRFTISLRHPLSQFINEFVLVNLRWRGACDKDIVKSVQVLNFRYQALVLHFLIKASF